MLLSAALLIANKSLICGMTDGDMIKSTTLLTISLEQDNLEKLLWELIESVEKRSDALQEFVSDVSDGIKCETVPIYDPFGPGILIQV
jgi:phosphopantetheine adenylyltransferase